MWNLDPERSKDRGYVMMKICKFSASSLLRGVSAVVLAGAVALGLGLPAKASLIGDMITVEVTICTAIPADCTDTVTVVDPAAEFTTTPNTPASDIGTNFLSFGTNSFININDSTIDFFFDFAVQTSFIFTGLEWQNESGEIGIPDFFYTTGTLSSDPDFSNITASSFIMGMDCVDATGCTSGTTGVGWTVNLNPIHGEPPDPDPVPEPDTLALFGVGLLGLGLLMLRRRRQTT